MDDRPEGFEEHHHEALVHTHEHFHVTHNFNEATGSFEHLASMHSHEHDHGEMTHSHLPHENFENEHRGEAHVHDHDAPVKKATRAKTSTAKKTTKTPAAKAK